MRTINKLTKLVLSFLLVITCINFSIVQAEDGSDENYSEPTAVETISEEPASEPEQEVIPEEPAATEEIIVEEPVVEEETTVEEPVEEEKEAKYGLESTGLESESKPSKKLVPHTDYVSKFEDFAGAGKKEEKVTKKRKKKDDDDRRLRGENLEKKEYDEDVKPTYSEEELEEIRQQEEELEEDSWINDDDIDFDEYDEYYDEEN